MRFLADEVGAVLGRFDVGEIGRVDSCFRERGQLAVQRIAHELGSQRRSIAEEKQQRFVKLRRHRSLRYAAAYCSRTRRIWLVRREAHSSGDWRVGGNYRGRATIGDGSIFFLGGENRSVPFWQRPLQAVSSTS